MFSYGFEFYHSLNGCVRCPPQQISYSPLSLGICSGLSQTQSMMLVARREN